MTKLDALRLLVTAPREKDMGKIGRRVIHEKADERVSPDTMTPLSELGSRLRRDVAFTRAAQLLADADRLRDGLPRLQLRVLAPKDRDFYTATARALIEVFETMTIGKEPDAVVQQREADAAQKEVSVVLALEARFSMERSRARVDAAARGHDLSLFRPVGRLTMGRMDSEETAVCVRCSRPVYIDIGGEPVLSGAALTEGCLVAADESADPRRC